MLTLTQSELGEGPQQLHGRCHPAAGTHAIYADGLLTLECAHCGREVTRIAVAEAKSVPLTVISTAVRHLPPEKAVTRDEIAKHLAHYIDSNLGAFDRHAFVRECGSVPALPTYFDRRSAT